MAATEIQIGRGKVWGMDGADFVYGAVTTTTTTEGADMEDGSTIEEIKGQGGELETLISSNRMRSLTINFTPYSETSRALAAAEADKLFTAGPISKVTTSGFTIAAYNGDWYMEGHSSKMVRDGVAVFTIKLKAPVNAAARTLVTGTPISG